jgi:serine/threonine protein kinase/Flp pilus assembly protein TadD
LVAQTVSHYRIIRKLGTGGMGEVFLAEDTSLNRKVAIKRLRAKALGNKQAQKRLIREAKAAAALDHPNICAIHEIGEEGDGAFIVMQYAEGETLAHRLDNNPPELDEAVDIASQIAEALVEAHSHGIVHRDIKPQNIIINSRGQVKVLDFGLAKLLHLQPVRSQTDTETLLTDSGMAVGTVHYMSPEQAKGERVDARSDIFALGALLYKCVTGRTAFSGNNTIEVCAQVIHMTPPPPSQVDRRVPPALDRVILKALEKNIEARYQSAGEMLKELRELQRSLEGSRTADRRSAAKTGPLSLPSSSIVRLFGRIRRGSSVRTVLIIGLPLALLTAWWALSNRRPHEPPPGAKRWYEIGTNALREGAYYQASKALQSAVDLDTSFALAHARLAEAFAELDYTVRAKDELLTAQSLVPNRAALPQLEAGYMKAISAVLTHDFATAIDTYRSLAERASGTDKPSLLLDLGRSYEKNENIKAAIDAYEGAARLDPESPAAFLRSAILYGRQQKLKEAAEAFDKAEEIYQRLSNTEGQAEVFYQRGVFLANTGRLTDARAKLETALRMSRDAHNAFQQIRMLLQLSNLSMDQGNTVRAKEYATEAIAMAQANDIRTQAINGLIDLGYAFMKRGEVDESAKSLKQALDFAQADKARLGEARALLGLGNLHLQLDSPDDAIRCLDQALDFYQTSGYRRQTSTCLLLLGRANRQKGEYDTSVQVSEQTLQLAKELGDQSRVAAAHGNIGYVRGIEQERYPDGLAHIDESWKINESLADRLAVGYDLMNRGRLLWQLGRYDEAREALSRALSIADQPDASYKLLLAWVYLANAQMALSESRLAEAKKQSQRVLDLAPPRVKDVIIQAKCALGLAQALSGAPQSGKALCEEAVNTAREMSSPRLLSTSLLTLAEVMLKTKNEKESLSIALQAQASFERFGQQESEWRAWLIAARACQLLGCDSAFAYADRAAAKLSSFEQTWEPQAYAKYLTRPDVRICRKQIDQIRTVSK